MLLVAVRGKRPHPIWRPWPSHLGLMLISSLLVRLFIPTAAIGVAFYAESHDFWLLRWLGVNDILGGFLAALLLDRLIYGHHSVFHALPLLWQPHCLHYSEVRAATDSNFGFCLAVWNRIFSAHIPESAGGQLGMVVSV